MGETDGVLAPVEAACATDWDAIARLHADSWRRTYLGMLPDAVLGPGLDAVMSRKWTDPAPGRVVFVLRGEHGLEGFAACIPGHADGVLLDNLHVAAAFRGRGVARALMVAVARMAGTRPLWLEVLEANTDARAVYRRWGGVEGAPFEDRLLGAPVTARRVTWTDARSLADRLGAA